MLSVLVEDEKGPACTDRLVITLGASGPEGWSVQVCRTLTGSVDGLNLGVSSLPGVQVRASVVMLLFTKEVVWCLTPSNAGKPH